MALVMAMFVASIIPMAQAAGQPPKAPKDVTCTAEGDGVHVSWDASTGATSYGVWRKVGNNGEWIKIGTTSDTSYVDHTAASGQLYHYAISAINGNGESDRGGTCNITSIPFFPSAFALVAAVGGSAGIAGVILSRRRKA